MVFMFIRYELGGVLCFVWHEDVTGAQVFVSVRGVEWNVYRRYTEFREFHRQLQKHLPEVATFNFPPKKAIKNKVWGALHNISVLYLVYMCVHRHLSLWKRDGRSCRIIWGLSSSVAAVGVQARQQLAVNPYSPQTQPKKHWSPCFHFSSESHEATAPTS